MCPTLSRRSSDAGIDPKSPALQADSLQYEPPRKPIYIYSLEKVMATHSSILAWKSPWTEEPGRIQSQGSLCQVLQVCRSSIVLVAQSCLALCNPMDCSLPGSFVHGILQSRILFPPPGDLPNQRIKPRSPALDSYYWTARKALCFDINFKISTFS